METAEKRPMENEMKERKVEKAKPPYKRVCKLCSNKTLDEHETICLKCGASTRVYEDK